MSDIRKWFMKKHDKGNGNANKPAKPVPAAPVKPSTANSQPEKQVSGEESVGRKKTSKYFDKGQPKPKEAAAEIPAKRKTQIGNEDFPGDVKVPPAKKAHRVVDDDDDDDFIATSLRKKSTEVTPSKKLKSSSGRGVAWKVQDLDESDDEKDAESPLKSSVGRGRGGRGASSAVSGGRGRGGGGRGGFMSFGERKDPPHKGEKEVPEGAPDCLAGLTFVISGTLDSLEREEAEDLIKRHGGRVTGSISKKTNYLLCDEDIGGRKSSKARELGTTFLTEDGLFDMIRASSKSKSTTRDDSKKPVDKVALSTPKKSPQKVGTQKKDDAGKSSANSVASKASAPLYSNATKKDQTTEPDMLWTEKYRPKVPNDLVGNQSIVKQIHDWLSRWDDQFLYNKAKGKKQNDPSVKKAVLLSGTPGIGKTTTAKLVSKMLGYEAIEVNASDSRGKADGKIVKGIGGSTANSVKELVNNESLSLGLDRSKHQKTVLIMDEVDGMSAGDRGGVADLIASIKISKIPIICICNDRYSQKLKSLVNYCMALNFRKPTKQQMAKRLMQIAKSEGLQVNEVALEELAEMSKGDMRMCLNRLQYMSLSMSVIKYDDIRQRHLSSAKDEDISPFSAVDKLFGFNGGKLRMDERIDLSMSDMDLVPLIIQENYINYRPSSMGKDDDGMKRMNLISRAAESIADGDIINVQIRRYRQWQLSQSGSISSCIIPAALMHGQREVLEQGERNFNRFGGWLGKNSTMGKNFRLLEDMHVHILASGGSNLGRQSLRLDYMSLFMKQLTEPLRTLPKDEAVNKVVEFMDSYSISQEDFDSMVELSKFKGHQSPLDGIQPAVKSALTKAYKEGSRSRVVKAADLVTMPGIKKAPKKRIAAILDPVSDELAEENGEADAAGNEDEESSDTEDSGETVDGMKKLQLDLETNPAKGVQVQVELKGSGNSGPNKKPTGRGKGSSEPAQGKKRGRGASTVGKRKI